MKVYRGNEPFIFVSYSHKDTDIVLPILESLERERYRFWYDEGIYSGDEWAAVIEQRIVDCACVIALISQNAVESKNCRNEIHFSLSNGKKLKLVHLADVKYAYGLGLQLASLDHDTYDGNPEGLVEHLSPDEALQECQAKHSPAYPFWWPQSHTTFVPLSGKENDRDETMLSAWGPKRPGFEYGTYPSEGFELNACTNHPKYGDERTFATIRRRRIGYDQWMREVTLVPGEQYEVKIHCRVHGNPELNGGAHTSVACALSASVYVPRVVMPHHRGTVRSALHAINVGAHEQKDEVWSCIYLYATDEPVFLRYVLGSAKIHNTWKADGNVIPTSLFSETGTLLGLDGLNGVVPSGDDYTCTVTFVFDALSHHGDCAVERSARVGDGEWKTGCVSVSPGDRVAFRTRFRNVTDADLTNVTFVDKMPPELTLVAGTTTMTNHAHPDGQMLHGDGIARNGYNTGLYGPGAFGTIEYETVVPHTSRPLNLHTQSGVYHDGGSKVSNLLLHVSGEWDGPDHGSATDPQDPKEREYLEEVPRGGWGPSREMFTMRRPAPQATFNSISDNPTVGDERVFVRIRRDDSGLPYDLRLKIEPGMLYRLWIGYDNSAAPNAGESGVARDVRVRAEFPSHLEPFEWKHASATISSSTTAPPEVWAHCMLWSSERVRLRFVPESAELHNSRYKGLRLDERILGPEGIPIGTNSLDGVLPSSDSEAFGHITLLLAAEPG